MNYGTVLCIHNFSRSCLNTAYVEIRHLAEKAGNLSLLFGWKSFGPFDSQTNYMILNMVSNGENTLRATARGIYSYSRYMLNFRNLF